MAPYNTSGCVPCSLFPGTVSTDGTSCNACPGSTPIAFNGAFCSANCGQGFFISGSSCSVCGPACLTCTSATQCFQCFPGFQLQSGVCNPQPPPPVSVVVAFTATFTALDVNMLVTDQVYRQTFETAFLGTVFSQLEAQGLNPINGTVVIA